LGSKPQLLISRVTGHVVWVEFHMSDKGVNRDLRITSGLPAAREGPPGTLPSQCLPKISYEEELRAVCKELFIPQRDHGIYAHGAAGWDVGGQKGDGG
jgi:hypothetical protein